MIDTTSIIDVGCDHALLDLYLAKNRDVKCTAIDVRENIVNNVINVVKKENLEHNIKVLLNDGLNNISIKNSDTVILSGLGTKTILNIIQNKKIENLIIQSNDNLYELRKFLTKHDYYISDEKIILDGKYYIIIKFKLGRVKYSCQELLFGPVLMKKNSSIFKYYLSERKLYYEKLVRNIPNTHLKKKIKIKRYLNYLKKTLNM